MYSISHSLYEENVYKNNSHKVHVAKEYCTIEKNPKNKNYILKISPDAHKVSGMMPIPRRFVEHVRKTFFGQNVRRSLILMPTWDVSGDLLLTYEHDVVVWGCANVLSSCRQHERRKKGILNVVLFACRDWVPRCYLVDILWKYLNML